MVNKTKLRTIEEVLGYKEFHDWQFDYLVTRDGYAKYFISTKRDLGKGEKGSKYDPNFVLGIPEDLFKEWGRAADAHCG